MKGTSIREAPMAEGKWLDISCWTIELVHHVLEEKASEGWELESMREAPSGQILLRLVRRGAA